MVAWWLLSPLFLLLVMVSSCTYNGCDKKDRGLNSFLWTVKRSPPAYLFGTIHVPYNRVWDWIPNNTKMAFTDTDSAIFELDLTDPYTLTALAECQMLPSGQTLSDYLPVDLYGRLQQHLDYVRASMPQWMSPEQKRKGLFADYLFNAITGNWRRKRPVWVMLMVNSLTESDVKSRGIPVLDLYLAQHAERDGKMTGAVERVEEQCMPLNQLNLSQVVFALNQTLSRHESFRALESAAPCGSDALIHHYNCGDLNSLMFNRDTTKVPTLVNSSLPPEDFQKALMIEDYFQQELIDKRNARMADRVALLLREHPDTSFFFAFGAGHFLGNETVIDRLRRSGVEIIYTSPEEDITRIRHDKRNRKERRKLMRAKKRQEQLDSIWENLDPSRFNTKRQSKSGSGTKKKQRSDRKNFNDLWVRRDQIRPRHLQQMGSSTFVQGNAKDIFKEKEQQKVALEKQRESSGAPVFSLTTTTLVSGLTALVCVARAMSSILI